MSDKGRGLLWFRDPSSVRALKTSSNACLIMSSLLGSRHRATSCCSVSASISYCPLSASSLRSNSMRYRHGHKVSTDFRDFSRPIASLMKKPYMVAHASASGCFSSRVCTGLRATIRQACAGLRIIASRCCRQNPTSPWGIDGVQILITCTACVASRIACWPLAVEAATRNGSKACSRVWCCTCGITNSGSSANAASTCCFCRTTSRESPAVGADSSAVIRRSKCSPTGAAKGGWPMVITQASAARRSGAPVPGPCGFCSGSSNHSAI
mmetsp:Transcript_36727/g.82683  ORF Transcript_36727/g.82683 Transcript_36727/m.82683 type:complete len:268 (-) Transcript_36727:1184-1987(-)